MVILLILLILIGLLGWLSYQYYKMTVSEIFSKLIELDKIFEARFNDLTKAIAQFQNYLPDQKNLIFDIQQSKVDVAKVSKPKTTKEMAQKILNENALSINLNFLISKCNIENAEPEVKGHIQKQIDYIKQIETAAQSYNKLLADYKNIKNIFPFNYYSKIKKLDLDLEFIKTE